MSWIVAPPKARRNSLRLPDCARDTMVLVTEVPMLAPMMMKMDGGTGKTVIQERQERRDRRKIELKVKHEICSVMVL